MMGLLKNVCGQKSMRSMEENFNTENVLTALQIMSADASLQEIPCADSLNYYLSKLQPQELSNVRCKMIRHLIRSRTFDNFRFLENTGLLCWMVQVSMLFLNAIVSMTLYADGNFGMAKNKPSITIKFWKQNW